MEKLRDLIIPASAFCIGLDVKEFPMTGRHADFVESCSRHVNDEWTVSFCRAAGLLSLVSPVVPFTFFFALGSFIKQPTKNGCPCCGYWATKK